MDASILSNTLNQIVSDKGKDVLKNGTQVVNLFADYCPQGTIEKNKLKSAYEHGVIQELIKNTNGQKDATAAVNKAIQDLRDKAFMDEKIATAFIYEIAEVLKLKYTPKPVSAPVVTLPTAKVSPPPPTVSSATNAQNSKQPENTQRTQSTNQQRASSRQQTVANKPNFKMVGIISGVAAMLLIITVVFFVNQDRKNRGYCTLELSYDNSSYIVTGYEGKQANVSIPTAYKGKPVKSIANEAFEFNKTIETIAIPDSVTSIGEAAFFSCVALQSVVIPDSVISIGRSAFSACIALQSVKISDNITSIESGVFGGCINLKNITIPASVTTIDKEAFGYCSELESVIIPDSVTHIGYDVFVDCKSLKKIYFEGDVEDWCKITFDHHIKIDWELYINNNLITDIVIPDTVEEINNYAFAGCYSLKSISISESVTRVGDNAFSDCSSLQFNEYGYQDCNGIYLGNDANPYRVLIEACESTNNQYLVNFEIHNQTEVIADNAFGNIGGYGSVSIPDSIKYIGTNAFEGAWNLKYNDYDNAYYLGNENNPYLLLIDAKSRSITSCEIHPDTKVIAGNAFYDCAALQEITIPQGVTTLCNNAFNGCITLLEVVIPSSVTHIGSYVFADSLTYVTVPASIINIGTNAFTGTEYITFGGTREQWASVSKKLQFPPIIGDAGQKYTKVTCTDGTLTYTSMNNFE